MCWLARPRGLRRVASTAAVSMSGAALDSRKNTPLLSGTKPLARLALVRLELRRLKLRRLRRLRRLKGLASDAGLGFWEPSLVALAAVCISIVHSDLSAGHICRIARFEHSVTRTISSTKM